MVYDNYMTRDEITHYDVLGVPRSANSAEIWEARRDLLAGTTDPDEIEKIEKAYEVLSNRDWRIRYDTDLHIRARMRGEASGTAHPESQFKPQFSRPITAKEPPPRYANQAANRSEFSRTKSAQEPSGWFGRRIPKTPLGWALLILSVAIFIYTELPEFDAGSEENSVVYDFMTSEARSNRAAINALADQNATIAASVGSKDAEEYYNDGLRYLARSDEPNDSSEQLAAAAFSLATREDDRHRGAYLELGKIMYGRWLRSGRESELNAARLYLGRYEELVIGSVDSEVQAILDVMSGDEERPAIEATSAPPISPGLDFSDFGLQGTSAEIYYRYALQHLENSREPGDTAEYIGLNYLNNALNADPDYAPAYLKLGEVHYEHWQADGSASSKRQALQHLSHYSDLRNGSIDERVQSMLAALE